MERKIYNCWAFTQDQDQKGKINRQIYMDELKNKAKLIQHNEEVTEEDFEKYMCYEYVGSGFHHVKYRILSNPHNFTLDEQALICDDGNLRFGYRLEKGLIIINTD